MAAPSNRGGTPLEGDLKGAPHLREWRLRRDNLNQEAVKALISEAADLLVRHDLPEGPGTGHRIEPGHGRNSARARASYWGTVSRFRSWRPRRPGVRPVIAAARQAGERRLLSLHVLVMYYKPEL